MSIFGKKALKEETPKKKSLKERMDEILEEVENLSEEEQKSFWSEYEDAKDESNGKPDTEEQIEKAEEDIAEKGADEQTEKDRIDESVGEQEKQEGDEDTQDAKDRVDESLGEQKYVRQEDYDALLKRVEALEKANGNDELPKPEEVDEDEDKDWKQSDFFRE